MQRAILLVLPLVVVLATAGCGGGDSPDSSTTMPTPGTQETPSPGPEATSRTGGLVIPDPDELVIPTISESHLEASRRSIHSEPSIRVEGSSVIYIGETNTAGYDKLTRLAEQGSITELAITSPGGTVFWGIKIGELVYENSWDVHVRGLCFSSCANYVFPAGRNKVIEDGGIVGWHGSARQDYFFAERNGISVRKLIVDTTAGSLLRSAAPDEVQFLDQVGFNRMVARFVAEQEMVIELERAFYERIGVDADISVYGHFPKRWAAIQGSGGWAFTLEDMAKFGLDNITYEGSEAYPSDKARALYSLVLIEVDDR